MIFLSTSVCAQLGQFKLQMNLFDFESKQPLAGALITNKKDTVFSNFNGHFTIHLGLKDSIHIYLKDYQELHLQARVLRGKESLYLKYIPAMMLDEVEVAGRKSDFYLQLGKGDTLKTFYMNMPDTSTLKGESRQFGGHKHRGSMVRIERDTTRPDGQIQIVVYGALFELTSLYNKKEQERRKVMDINYNEKFHSSFWKAINEPSLEIEFMNRYGVDEADFLGYKNYFIQNNDSLKIGYHSLHVKNLFFEQYLGYLRSKN